MAMGPCSLVAAFLSLARCAAAHAAGPPPRDVSPLGGSPPPPPALLRKEVAANVSSPTRQEEAPPASLLNQGARAVAQEGSKGEATGQAGVQQAQAQARFQVDAHRSWVQLSSWVNSNGGNLDASDYHTATTHHAQTLIRGLVASRRLNASAKILRVPKKMWLHLDNFPVIAEVKLNNLPSCSGMSRSSTDLIKLATAIAVEMHQGPASWWSEYLHQLPTMAYYRTFHLHYAGEDVLSDFAALPVVPLVQHMQKHDQDLKECWSEWQMRASKVGGPLEMPELRWDDVELAMMHARTRAVSVGKGQPFAVVPGVDFFNTGDADTRNVNWEVSKKGDAVEVRTVGPVPQGAELLDAYCEACDNSRLLLLWGVMLDGNPNVLDPAASRAFCSTSPAGAVGSSDVAVALRDIVASLLEVGHGNRPRCLALEKPPKEAAKKQAPLRCALASLALEYCAETWAGESRIEKNPALGRGEFMEMSQELRFSGMTMEEATDTVLGSAGHSVHPFLVSTE